MARPLFGLICVALLLVACDEGGNLVKRSGEPPVQMVEADDPAMKAAFEAARNSLPEVVAQLNDLQTSGITVSIKVPVSENGVVEHIWLYNMSHSDGEIRGFLANTPIDLPSWSYGDEIAVPIARVSDWMVIHEDQLYGGYTLFALRDRLNGEDRAEFEAAVGIPFPDSPRDLQQASLD